MATIEQIKTSVQGAASSFNVTFDSATGSARTIAVCFSAYENDETGNFTITGVTGNKGETDTAAVSRLSVDNVWRNAIYVAPNVTGGSSHQITIAFSETVLGLMCTLVELSGCDLTTPVDTTGNAGSVSSGQPSGGAATPSAAGIHLSHITILAPSAATFTPGAGWTEGADFNDAAVTASTLIHRTAANGVSQTPSATASVTPDAWQIVHVVLKDAAASGGFSGPFSSRPSTRRGARRRRPQPAGMNMATDVRMWW